MDYWNYRALKKKCNEECTSYSVCEVSWKKDPSRFPVNEWMRDIVVNYGEIKDKTIYGDTWTVLVRVTRHIEGTWDTYADVAFIVDEAPWQLLKTGYSFNLWAGKDIAIVTIV